MFGYSHFNVIHKSPYRVSVGTCPLAYVKGNVYLTYPVDHFFRFDNVTTENLKLGSKGMSTFDLANVENFSRTTQLCFRDTNKDAKGIKAILLSQEPVTKLLDIRD
ncbi:hypothetical protein RUM44_003518 [Polyplax serrata]|uniref:Uncharacterized protein n=1 Tax=Polyplax serrata TaxID=468196 RepID=A0ABR1AGQ8_POLSC